MTHTTTDFFSPSSPRSFSIKSRTSRPLSPINAMTLTSALQYRLIMPSKVLLPTPLPEKIPILWPSPHVRSPSIARIPVGMILVIRFLFRGLGGVRSTGQLSRDSAIPLSSSSIGSPRPLSTFPSKSSPAWMVSALPVGMTLHPDPTPFRSPSGISSTCRSRNPTTSAITAEPFPSSKIRQTSPTNPFIPCTMMVRPITWVTFPAVE